MPRAEYALFLKAAVSGKVKTRLASTLGEAGACALFGRMREHVLALFTGERAPGLVLWVTPQADEQLLEWAARFGWRIEVQVGCDLGERMERAVSSGLARAQRVVLLGGDCPWLCEDDLDIASAARGCVLGPAVDGGYWLLALDAAFPGLFRDMPWGGSAVAALTRQRLAAAGRSWRELAVRADIDRPEDLPLLEGLGWRRIPGGDGSRPAPG